MSTSLKCALSGYDLPPGTPVVAYVVADVARKGMTPSSPSDCGCPMTGPLAAVIGDAGIVDCAPAPGAFIPLSWHGIRDIDGAELIRRLNEDLPVTGTNILQDRYRAGLWLARGDIHEAVMDDPRLAADAPWTEQTTREALRAGADRFIDTLLDCFEAARTGKLPDGHAGANDWKRRQAHLPDHPLINAMHVFGLVNPTPEQMYSDYFLSRDAQSGGGKLMLTHKPIITHIRDEAMSLKSPSGDIGDLRPDTEMVARWRSQARTAAEIIRIDEVLGSAGMSWGGKRLVRPGVRSCRSVFNNVLKAFPAHLDAAPVYSP